METIITVPAEIVTTTAPGLFTQAGALAQQSLVAAKGVVQAHPLAFGVAAGATVAVAAYRYGPTAYRTAKAGTTKAANRTTATVRKLIAKRRFRSAADTMRGRADAAREQAQAA